MAIRGEFDFIERIKGVFGEIGDRNIEGIGDDCAVIPMGDGMSLVVTTDMLVEGVHFLREAISPAELGSKSLAVNLSDVAAMGAVPVASLLSVALPAECTNQWADSFVEGYRAMSARYDVALIGGDTTSSHNGVTINIVAIGRIANTNIKRRGMAQVGDRIFVAGMLGDSAAGLKDILAGKFDTEAARTHHNPLPQVEEGAWLGLRSEVHAMIDISDGLASDLPHILKLSGVDAVVDLERIPTSVDTALAITGGEDYKLLLTVAPDRAAELKHEYANRFEEPLYEIGEIMKQLYPTPTLVWHKNGEKIDINMKGYTHF